MRKQAAQKVSLPHMFPHNGTSGPGISPNMSTQFEAAISYLDEKEILFLLKIARPEDINAHYRENQKFLHYAVKNEKYVLARALIQVYGADKTAVNLEGKTSFELGTRDENSVLGEHSWMFKLSKPWWIYRSFTTVFIYDHRSLRLVKWFLTIDIIISIIRGFL